MNPIFVHDGGQPETATALEDETTSHEYSSENQGSISISEHIYYIVTVQVKFIFSCSDILHTMFGLLYYVTSQ